MKSTPSLPEYFLIAFATYFNADLLGDDDHEALRGRAHRLVNSIKTNSDLDALASQLEKLIVNWEPEILRSLEIASNIDWCEDSTTEEELKIVLMEIYQKLINRI